MSEPKDFQKRSAERIVSLFANGQRRVLLADEVGLGKTIVARAVVEMMHKNAKDNGQSFKVIYVCSNQGIIQQNAHKLGIDNDNVVPQSESRLSMQHRNLYQQLDKDYLIPITPSTSLRQTDGYGNANERALIYSLIKEDFEPEQFEALKRYLDVYAFQEHTPQFSDTNLEKITSAMPDYYVFIRQLLSNKEEYKSALIGIKQELAKEKPLHTYINDLRSLFCEISMEMIQPDLVIMDEFQRYRDLMQGGKDTEENRLAHSTFDFDR